MQSLFRPRRKLFDPDLTSVTCTDENVCHRKRKWTMCQKTCTSTPSQDSRTSQTVAQTPACIRPPLTERQQLTLLLQMTTARPASASLKTPLPCKPGDKVDFPADVRLARRLHKRNERGETPIQLATIRGDAKQVSRLVRLGADVNCVDFAGWSPLHEACNYGWLQVAQLLIEAGASVDARGPDGVTPLHDAAINGHHKLVELLLQSKANRAPVTALGQTPLVLGHAHPQVVDLLQSEVTASYEPSISSSHDDQGGTDKQLTPKPSSQSDTKPELCLNNMRKSSPQHQTPRGPDKPSSPRLTLRFQPIKTRDDHHGGGGGPSSKTSSEVSSTEPRYQSYCVTMETGEDVSAGYGKLKRSSSGGADNHHQGAPPPPTALSSTANGDHSYDHQQQNTVTSSGSGGRFPTSGGQQQPQHYHALHSSDSAEFNHRAASAVNSHNERHGRPAASDQRSFDGSHHSDETDCNGDASAASQNNHARPAESEGADDDSDDGRRKRRKEYERDSAGGKSCAKLPAPAANNGGGNMSLRNYGGKGSGGVGSNGDERKSPHRASDARNNSGSDTESTPSDAEHEVESGGVCEVAVAPEAVSAAACSGLPKVPPLKIVIPPSAASEQDRDRNRMANRQALPYIVSVSGDTASDGLGGGVAPSGSSADKEGVVREDGKSRDGMGGGITDEQRSQRVTRSRAALGGPPVTLASTAPVTSGQLATSSTVSTVAVLNSSSSGVLSFGPLPESGGQVATTSTSSSSSTVSTATVALPAAEVMASSGSAPAVKSKYEAGECSAEEQCGSDVPPCKRKLRTRDGPEGNSAGSSASSSWSSSSSHCEEQTILNCYEMYLNIRRQIDRRRKGMFVVQPKPPQGFKDYLMNRCSYVLAGNSASRLSVPMISPPQSLTGAMKELFESQEKERYNLRLQHLIEKEKLVLMVEQEILRVHGRAARATANQTVPLSACTILRDEEIYNQIEPEQEEKERNARTRFTGRHLLSWLQDVDDKWEKVKEAMLLRHHNEAESLHAAQKLEWEWKMKELSMCDIKSTPVIDVIHVPMVHISPMHVKEDFQRSGHRNKPR